MNKRTSKQESKRTREQENLKTSKQVNKLSTSQPHNFTISMNNNNPLVSIIVITYNSSKFVLETLESAKAQTYQNIELIVSDDGSKDNTVEICRNWLAENKERFVNTTLLTVEENTGIPANCNRGVKVAQGEWIKLIAGDDAFVEDGIENFIKMNNSDSLIIQTNADIYKDLFCKENYLRTFRVDKKNSFFTLSTGNQYKALKYWWFINAPAVFINKRVFERILYDEEFKRIEDRPFWIKATKYGFHIDYINVLTVKYRVSDLSVSGRNLKGDNPKKVYNTNIQIRAKYYENNVRFYTFHKAFLTYLYRNFKFMYNVFYWAEHQVVKKVYLIVNSTESSK